MTNTRQPTKRASTYIVANPRGIPPGIPVFRQGDRAWFEGDVYDGTKPAEALRRGFLKEVE